MTAKKSPLALAEDKLASSGISLYHASCMGMEGLAPAQTAKLGKHFKEVLALKIPYWDPRDPTMRTPLAFLPKWPPHFRVRYLQKVIDDAGKEIRYVQAADSGMCAFFPRLVTTPWAKILADTSVDLIITEGELKAAKACIEGFPTIGLGGVWSFSSHKHGVAFLTELEAVQWSKRTVRICYDSDAYRNPHIPPAFRALVNALRDRGALPHLVQMPDLHPEPQKTGIDDFLVEKGPAEFKILLDSSLPCTNAESLWRFNSNFVCVEDPGLVADLYSGQQMSFQKFRDLHDMSRTLVYHLRDDGVVIPGFVGVATEWLKWSQRFTVGRMSYLPGRPTFILNCEPKNTMFNSWKGWGVGPKFGPMTEKPKNHSVKPFLKLFNYLFSSATEAQRKWAMQWLAYPIVHPGTKMYSSLVVYGARQGTGKTMLGEIMGNIYGEPNYTEIKASDLQSDFNEWAADKQFAMGDEITGSDKRHETDKLKKLITQKYMWINIKHVPGYKVLDCLNFYFTSNQPDAFFMDKSDRRYAVFQTPNETMSDAEYREIKAWADSPEGALSLRWHFEREVDLSGFSPSAHAIETIAKDLMTQNSRSDLTTWIVDMLANPDAMLREGAAVVKDELLTSRRLLALYDPERRTKATAPALAREMSRAEVEYVCGGQPIRTSDGVQARYFPIRNLKKWARATPNEVRAYLDRIHAPEAQARQILAGMTVAELLPRLPSGLRKQVQEFVKNGRGA